MDRIAAQTLNILFLESSLNFGGQERRLLNEALWFSESGSAVVIACPDRSELYRKAAAAGLKVYAVSMRRALEFSSILTLRMVIRRHRINMIYSHSGKDSTLGGLSGLCAGVPLVRSRELLGSVRHKASYNILPRRILACSKAVRDHLVESGVSAGKIFVQYPPVSVKKYNSVSSLEKQKIRDELKLDGCSPVIACVAVLRSEKRQIDAIMAMKSLRKEFAAPLLLLAGEGPDRQLLQSIAAESELSQQVRFLGERDDIPAILANTDVFILPSCREPFGMAPIEAMAAGVPVVVTRTGGLAEIVTDGVDGLHVPVGSPEAIARAVTRICRNADLRTQLVTAGLARAKDFDEEVMMSSLARHFQEVAGLRHTAQK